MTIEQIEAMKKYIRALVAERVDGTLGRYGLENAITLSEAEREMYRALLKE